MKKLKEKKKIFIDFEDLFYEIGFDPLDINEFYTKNIKHRLRYEREVRV